MKTFHAYKFLSQIVRLKEILVIFQLWSTFHQPEQVARAFQKSLDNLNIDYIDLYLMHAPLSYQRISKLTNKTTDDIDNIYAFPVDENGKRLASDVDYIDTWKAMEQLVESGKVRSLGLSNFNSEQLDRVISMGRIRPVVNQGELMLKTKEIFPL